MIDPLVSLTIRNPAEFHAPGSTLLCEYQIDAIGENEIRAIESSVMWRSEGKGDEDIGVHFFERRTPSDDGVDLRELHRFETVLPNSPLSYQGATIAICWCVRVRLFPKSGKETFFEVPFDLGIGYAPRELFWSDEPAGVKSDEEESVPELGAELGAEQADPDRKGRNR